MGLKSTEEQAQAIVLMREDLPDYLQNVLLVYSY